MNTKGIFIIKNQGKGVGMMKKRVQILWGMAFSLSLLTACTTTENASEQRPITVITREEGSGTRSTFVELTGILEEGIDYTSYEAMVLDSAGKVMTAVESDPNAIGYISLGSLNETVRALPIDGVNPSAEAIQDGSYALARPFYVIYGKDKPQTEVCDEFLEYLLSAEAQEIVMENHFTPIGEGNAFESTQPAGTIDIGGSVSVHNLMEKIVEGYEAQNPNATIIINSQSSSAGIKGVQNNVFDIGMISRDLTDTEEKTLDGLAFAKDGVAVVVNQDNEIETLSILELKHIYTDVIVDFSEVE